MIDLDERVLFATGISVVEDHVAIEKILTQGIIPEHIKVMDCVDGKKYQRRYRERIIVSEDDINEDRIHENNDYDSDEFEELKAELYSNKRDQSISDKIHHERLDKEFDYFERNRFQSIILRVHHLIQRFIENDVVWGVGRGSSCSCYVYFCMYVHDVNPIKYQLNFSEYSKEE